MTATVAFLLCAVEGAVGPHVGSTFYVSKLGDNTDGHSWAAAYTTVQAALQAVPDAAGGHRIIVRPDTYMEANLFPSHKGAAGAYNELIGDVDGSYGSGREGRVVIDSGDPALGFKSYDWWGTVRSYTKGWSSEHKDETFSALIWDRWRLKGLYATGGDGGLFFDGTDQVEPFSVVVEECVSIGRAFGGGVASVLSRPDEPITFRNCSLWALDWWGDTAGAYVRVENESMPERPDAVFENCTLVGPQCSLKASNFGFQTCTRVQLKGCRLLTLNFSQPQGTPSDGIIQSVQHGRQLHVDLEDCTLMGYKVFGVRVEKDTVDEIGFTTRGSVQAYVQFQQTVPAGFHRLGGWPSWAFDTLLPPSPVAPHCLDANVLIARDLCELSPVLWHDRLCHMECRRPGQGGSPKDYYLVLRDAETGVEVSRFAEGYGLASVIVHEGVFYAFASRYDEGNWNDVTLFRSGDLQTWEARQVIQQHDEHLFNSSVCAGPDGFVMAYESSDPAYPGFTTKFATSPDLITWTPHPQALLGSDRYTACPCIRYEAGFYYVLYLEHRSPRHVYETYIARSRDLLSWELSAANPVLAATGADEGINASDPELIQVGEQTYVYYAVGDQLKWMNIKRGQFAGSQKEFLERWFTVPGIPTR